MGREFALPLDRRTEMDRLLSVKEAAGCLGCSEALLRKWIYQGKLPFVKVGRLTRIRQADIEALMRVGMQSVQKGTSR